MDFPLVLTENGMYAVIMDERQAEKLFRVLGRQAALEDDDPDKVLPTVFLQLHNLLSRPPSDYNRMKVRVDSGRGEAITFKNWILEEKT